LPIMDVEFAQASKMMRGSAKRRCNSA
jgi:hypothetical protein